MKTVCVRGDLSRVSYYIHSNDRKTEIIKCLYGQMKV